ncbi:MAG TPA: MFS transporter [Xanthobacteraceae bacterium]|nr:MFS transporter [Xanthobacteraceae bacterium]
MPPRFALSALMLGNFVIGLAVLAPAGMVLELSKGLGVTIRDAGFLITAGAVVLCFGSPITAWLTSHFDRRRLLAATLFVLAAGQLASAFAPDYFTLLIVRVLMLAIGALYTPQAAGTTALIVQPEHRASAISYVFLGWALATAIGVPIINLLSAKVGWRETYALLAVIALIACVLQMIYLPSGLKGAPVSLGTWGAVARNHLIVLLLAITAIQVSGQFAIITYLSPLLLQLTGAGPETTSLFFAIFGISGFVGNVIATRIVDAIGAFRTSALSLGSIFAGLLIWTLGAGVLALMGAGVFFWGLGFAAANSMQQARLAAAAPELAPASIALNTSGIYVGQAVGSYLGGFLIARELLNETGWAAIGLLAVALFILVLTRETPRAMREQES